MTDIIVWVKIIEYKRCMVFSKKNLIFVYFKITSNLFGNLIVLTSFDKPSLIRFSSKCVNSFDFPERRGGKLNFFVLIVSKMKVLIIGKKELIDTFLVKTNIQVINIKK